MSWIKNNEWLQPDRDRTVRWRHLLRFAGHYRRFRGTLAAAASLALLGSLSTVFIPAVFRSIQHALAERDHRLLLAALAAFLAISLIEVAAGYAIGLLRARIATRLNRELLLEYYDSLLNLSVQAFMEFRRKTNLFQRIIDAMSITPQCTEILIRGGQAVIVITVVGVVIGRLSWVVLAVIGLGCVLLALFVYQQATRLRTLRQVALALNYPLVGKMTEVIGGLFTIKALSASLRVTSDIAGLIERKSEAERDEAAGEVRSTQGAQMLRVVTLLAAIAASFYELLAGRITVAEVLALYVLTNLLLNPFSELAGLYQTLSRLSVNVGNYYQVIDLPSETDEARLAAARRIPSPTVVPLLQPNGRAVPETDTVGRGRIEIRDVSFAYSAAVPVLEGVDLDIRAGEKISLIGRSGAGKTTLMRILLGFLQPLRGSVAVDGEDIATLPDKTRYRRRLGVVSQNDFLFGTSLRENLVFGLDEKLEDDAIRHALDLVGLGSTVAQLPEGLDTVYGEDLLSGGQKQRLFIARALLRDPAIVLLDEPTSALDFENERLVMKAIETLVGDRTTVTIAHRLSTVRGADRVVVLNEGRIVACGPHAELYANDHYYRELCDYNSFVV